MPFNGSKVLVIGVDAATMALAQRWVAEGHLPYLASFFSEGVYGRLDSVPNRNSAPAWSSMVTGVNPGKHGIFWFTALDGYRYRLINASHRHAEPIWNTLSRAGKRVSVINVPISYPADEVNGLVIAGIDAPGTDDLQFTYPRNLYKRLVQRGVGVDYIIEPGIPSLMKANKRDAAVDRLHRCIDARFNVAQHLMRSEPWDFFMVVFTAPDSAQHFFWKYMSPDGFEVTSEERADYGDVIFQVYRHIDEVVGRLMDSAGPETTVLIVSDHGGEADNRKARCLPLWLEELGFLRQEKEGESSLSPIRVTKRLALRAMAKLYRELDRRFDREFKLLLTKSFPRLRSLTESYLALPDISWGQTKAFSDGNIPAIWINLKGRQPEGTVNPGREYDAVCASIAKSLESLRDEATGQRVIERVVRSDEAYSGPYVAESPDLVVQWTEDLVLSDAVYDDGGQLISNRPRHAGSLRDPMDELISGGHSRQGIFLMKGPGIRRGVALSEVDILDVTPTILHLMEQPVPSRLDGRVLGEAFLPEHLTDNPIRIGFEAEAAENQPIEYDPDDAETLRKRLKGLGYID